MTVRPTTRRPVCADSDTLLATCTSRMADKLRLSTTDSNTHAAKSSLCSMPTTCGCQRNLRAFREAFERHHSAGMAYHRMYWWDGANEIEADRNFHCRFGAGAGKPQRGPAISPDQHLVPRLPPRRASENATGTTRIAIAGQDLP